jgi:hypothetical protein
VGGFEQEIAENTENASSTASLICNSSGTTANSRQCARMESIRVIRAHPRFKRGGVIPLPFNHGETEGTEGEREGLCALGVSVVQNNRGCNR